MAQALSALQSTPGFSENQLVAAVRGGDDRAFEELFSRYRSRIGSYVFGMVGDHGRAEDIAQEVFISALRRLRDTTRPIAFKPWIYEIAKNACIDEFRRTRRTREVPFENDEDSGGQSRFLSRDAGPDDAVEGKQRLDDLRGAFRGLSESHHRILVLRELEGLSYEEIGTKMGMTRPVVESTLFRARRRLGEEYEELVSGKRCQQIRGVIDAGEARSLRSLGLRGHRQLARHLAHCQPCRRHARMAGVDDSLFTAPSLPAKIAALLPIPWLRWRRGGGKDQVIAGSGSHSFSAMQSIQNVAPFLDPVSPAVGLGRVAAAAAALVIAAGAGGGLVTAVSEHHGSAAAGHHQAVRPTTPATVSAPIIPASPRAGHPGPGRDRLARGGGGAGSSTGSQSPAAAGHTGTARSQTSGLDSPSRSGSTPSGNTGGSGHAGNGGVHLQLPSVPSVPQVLGGGGGSSNSSLGLPGLQSTAQSVAQSTLQAAGQAVNSVNKLGSALGLPTVH